MTREEAMEYRRDAPHDAFGDYSVFEDDEKPKRKEDEENGQSDNGQGLRSPV